MWLHRHTILTLTPLPDKLFWKIENCFQGQAMADPGTTIHPEAAGNGYYLNIEGYYDKIHRTTWARRTAGLLAGATLGAVYGAVIGVVAAFVPYLLNALHIPGAEAVQPLSWSTVGSSAALFSVVTAGTGLLFGAEVAATSASSAVGMEEKEKREKLAQLKSRSPA